MTRSLTRNHADLRSDGSRRRRRLLPAALALAMVAATAVAQPAFAAIDVPNGTLLTITAGQQVFGDVTSTGNGMLTCGTCVLHTGGGTNNNVIMAYADTDADVTTFNSTSGRLTIPAGATVAKAWLMWEATGSTTATNGAIPATIATVRANSPLLSVNAAAYTNVGQADYLAQVTGGDMTIINGATDVTEELSALGDGIHTLTLANLASAQGLGRTAGWALHVTYDYGAYTPGNADSQPRKIYTAFGISTVFNSTQTVTFSGFQTTSPGATFLITAADGEPAGGDTTSAVWPGGSELLPNPATPAATNNAFNSFMDGANSYAPGVANAAFKNGNFDTYKTRSLNLPSGSTSVDFRFSSGGAGADGFHGHSVSMAVPVAQISVAKSPATGTADGQVTPAGQAPTFAIVITNESAVAVSGVTFTDANAVCCTVVGTPLLSAGGTFALPTPIGAAAQVTALCIGPVVEEGDANYVNTVAVTGLDPNGGAVSAQDTSPVFIPHVSLTKSADRAVVEVGETVTWNLAVVNDGGTDLRNVAVSDPLCTVPLVGPAGPGAPTLLAQGQTWTYSCTQPLLADTTNTATVTAEGVTTVGGQLVAGGTVSDQDDESVDVVPAPSAGIALTKTVDRSAVEEGETVTWQMVATNTGQQSLRGVQIADDDCTGTVSAPAGTGAPTSLAPGDAWTFTCTEAVTADKTNTATVTGTPFRLFNGQDLEGPAVTDDDSESVTVTAAPEPDISLEKTVTPDSVMEGDTVTWVIAVTNTGLQDLRGVSVTDADCTGALSAPTGPGAPDVLAQDATWNYTCSEVVTADKTNTASAVGTPFRTVNDVVIEGAPVSDEDSESVEVIAPVAHLTLTKTVDRAAVIAGETVTWSMTVENDGEQDLRNVNITDADCSGDVSDPTGPGAPLTLAQGDSWLFTCTEAVTLDKTNTAAAVATPFRTVNGEEIEDEPVTDEDSESVTVSPLPVPHVTLTKSVDDSLIDAGETVTWTIRALNDGESSLRNVVIADAGCSGPLSGPSGPGAPDALAPGDTWTYTCSEMVLADETNTATVSADSFFIFNGEETTGDPVTAVGEATVDVVSPTPAPSPPVSAGTLPSTGADITAGWIGLTSFTAGLATLAIAAAIRRRRDARL